MTYYLLFLILLILFLGLDSNDRKGIIKQENHALVFIAFLYLIVIRSFVDVISLPDLNYYEQLFEDCRTFRYDSIFEYADYIGVEGGFLLLTKICRDLSSSFSFELMVIGIIIVALYFRTIKLYSPYFWLGVLIYFLTIYPTSTYILRQYLAMSLLFGTIPFILERRIVPFVIVAVIAFFLHHSSVIWIPLYFIYGVKGKKTLALLLASFAAVFFVVDNLFSQALNMMGDNFERYQEYVEGYKVTTSYWGAMINTSLLILFLLLFKNRVFDEGLNRLLLIYIVISVTFSWFSINSVGLMFRLSVYFSQISILLIPKIVSEVKNIQNKRIIALLLVLINFLPNYLVKRDFHEHRLFFNDGLPLIIVVIIGSLIIFELFVMPNKRRSSISS
jgi:hypothetical protein